MRFMKTSLFKLLGAAMLTLSGCSTATAAADTAQAWQAPKDTARYYYAVGEGISKDAAKNSALSDISSRISVTIEATGVVEKLYEDDGEDERIRETMKNTVTSRARTIEYTNVKVEQAERIAERWHVLVRVDRKELFDHYLAKLVEQDKALDIEYDLFKQREIFGRIKTAKAVETALTEPKSTLVLLRTIHPAYDAASYADKYDAVTRDLRRQRTDAVFHIASDKNSKTLETLIKDRLSDQNIKTAGAAAANINLTLSTTVKERKIKSTNPKYQNSILVFRTTTIEVKDRAGNVISNNVVKTKSVSNQGVESAINQTRPYEKLIDKQGILSFLSGN